MESPGTKRTEIVKVFVVLKEVRGVRCAYGACEGTARGA
jgi:hypothetical protein